MSRPDGFSLFAYYVGVNEQIRQLNQTGLTDIDVYDMNGVKVEANNKFPWTNFLARKD